MATQSRYEQLKRMAELLLAAGTVLFAVSYGALRMAYVTFYEKLGLTPEQVGLNQFAIVTPVTTFVVTVLLIASAGFALVAALPRKLGWAGPALCEVWHILNT